MSTTLVCSHMTSDRQHLTVSGKTSTAVNQWDDQEFSMNSSNVVVFKKSTCKISSFLNVYKCVTYVYLNF